MKKRTVRMILIHIISLLVLFFVIIKLAEELIVFKQKLYDVKNYVVEKVSGEQKSVEATSEEMYPAFEEYPVLQHNDEVWYAQNRTICHATGGIDGLSYTNSKEALELSLQKGMDVIEVDFRFTSDGHLVCAHKWEDISTSKAAMTLEEFQNTKICGKYTPLTAAELIGYMVEKEDLYIVIDTKESNLAEVIRELVTLSNDDSEIMDRFIVQLYSLDDAKSQIREIYPFTNDNFLFTAYKSDISELDELLYKCYEQEISVITTPYGQWDDEWIGKLNEKGFIIYVHTVNRVDHAEKAIRAGVYGIYTDELTEADLSGL